MQTFVWIIRTAMLADLMDSGFARTTAVDYNGEARTIRNMYAECCKVTNLRRPVPLVAWYRRRDVLAG